MTLAIIAIIATIAYMWLCLTIWAWFGTDDIPVAAFAAAIITAVLALFAGGAYGLYLLWEAALS